VSIQRLAIHCVGNQDFSGMEGGIDLAKCESRLISIRTGGNHIVCERFATKLSAQRHSELAQQIRQPDTRIGLIGVWYASCESSR
jgi:hypothetical protein